jgi:hypothetical protein
MNSKQRAIQNIDTSGPNPPADPFRALVGKKHATVVPMVMYGVLL